VTITGKKVIPVMTSSFLHFPEIVTVITCFYWETITITGFLVPCVRGVTVTLIRARGLACNFVHFRALRGRGFNEKSAKAYALERDSHDVPK
jgi:hypothetical protein